MCVGEGRRGVEMGLPRVTHEGMGEIRHDSETIAVLEMRMKQMET